MDEKRKGIKVIKAKLVFFEYFDKFDCQFANIPLLPGFGKKNTSKKAAFQLNNLKKISQKY